MRGGENTLSVYVNNNNILSSSTNNSTRDNNGNLEKSRSTTDTDLLLSSPCYSGEIGKVHLSLRALLTSGLYQLG